MKHPSSLHFFDGAEVLYANVIIVDSVCPFSCSITNSNENRFTSMVPLGLPELKGLDFLLES